MPVKPGSVVIDSDEETFDSFVDHQSVEKMVLGPADEEVFNGFGGGADATSDLPPPRPVSALRKAWLVW